MGSKAVQALTGKIRPELSGVASSSGSMGPLSGLAEPAGLECTVHSESMGREEDCFLFPTSLLTPCLEGVELPAGVVIRSLAKEDYNRGFLQLLAQLTSVGEVDILH